MSKQNVEIIKPKLSIKQKLGNAKFNQIFDNKTLSEAEKAVKKSEQIFKAETLKDFAALKSLFGGLSAQKLDRGNCQKLCELAFSIKSRAATGGFPLASEIAESMYEFCDCDAATDLAPEESYKIIKLHFDALIEVFEKDLAKDAVQGKKLAASLKKITDKFLHSE